MNCDRFRGSLLPYLSGEVEEPFFGELVEHEAGCPACHALASEGTVNVEAGAVGGLALSDLLARTTGSDCAWIELRLAEALEDLSPPDVLEHLSRHLSSCSSCRRMREVLSELPVWYETYPVVHPDRRFVRDVLERTIGPEPGFLDVVRSLWRRPEAVWEAAAACALLTTLLFGDALPGTYRQIEQTVNGSMERVLPSRAGLEDVRGLLGAGATSVVARAGDLIAPEKGPLRTRWERLHGFAVRASDWTERVGRDLRSGDYPSVLQEINAALRPLGLDLDPGTQEKKEDTP